MKLTILFDGFQIDTRKGPIIRQSADRPFFVIGNGNEDISVRSGFFTVKDHMDGWLLPEFQSIRPLTEDEMKAAEGREEETVLGPKKANGPVLSGYRAEYLLPDHSHFPLDILLSKDACTLDFPFACEEKLPFNRFRFAIEATEREAVYGGGEQFSYLNLRHRHYPLWTSEPGIGRDKSTEITRKADLDGGNGGDYYTTYFPQQTYISSRDYYFHTFCTAYADFDFRNADHHELTFFACPKRVYFREGPSLLSCLEKLSELLGRQMMLPDFVYQGAILGLQGGTKRVKELTEKSKKYGVKTAGLFCQDWCGKFMDPAFGKRLRWDFRWDPSIYPKLPDAIHAWDEEGIRFLGYINPYLAEGGKLYEEAKAAGALLLDQKGEIYRMNSVSIWFGMVDLSSPRGFNWYKEVIKRELLDFGLSGWMADFGEYVPADCRPASGEDPKIWHNRFPAEWARCNYEACKEAQKSGQILYFMRSGATGSQTYAALQWQGDQSVDWSEHDGLPSALTGALSLTMSGYGLSHSDIGGYTSAYGNIRSRELFMRWAEFACFSPVMRTHEGNRPEENYQYYNDEAGLRHFARMTRIHVDLAPYLQSVVKENHDTGIGCMRPLVLQYEEDPNVYDLKTEYLLGSDLLIAPVMEEGISTRLLYLPGDQKEVWIGLFDGKNYTPGKIRVDAPLGKPPVFYRKGSPFTELFSSLTERYKA
ncbi:MAG: alpha-glucosidase [Lachnospiraceae bacterium]|nr:alpha-glucosidase [Lachnospiraceae bacterium]